MASKREAMSPSARSPSGPSRVENLRSANSQRPEPSRCRARSLGRMMSAHALSDTNTATPSEPKTAPANDDEARVTATVEQTKRTNEDTETPACSAGGASWAP